MGSCVSSSAPPLPTEPTAKVIGLDGSMAQYVTRVTAREALGSDASSSFLCSSDELRFDVPARALAAEEVLQPGWLYFVMPVSMLRRPLSGQDMAALAVKASSALAAVSNNGKGRDAARVAPLVYVYYERERELNQRVYGKYGARKTVHDGAGETAGKGAGHVSRISRRLNAISEASES
ncbi:unnamed protein product [Alopecurus aequalis]